MWDEMPRIALDELEHDFTLLPHPSARRKSLLNRRVSALLPPLLPRQQGQGMCSSAGDRGCKPRVFRRIRRVSLTLCNTIRQCVYAESSCLEVLMYA